jgi:uncharacterized membrane protein YbhN (UPF0104 family)
MIKQRLIYLSKFVIGAALVVFLILQVDQKKFIEYFLNLNINTLLLIFFLSSLSWIVQFQRWKYLVENNSINFDKMDLIPSFVAGFTFRLMLPGGHAEISKIYMLSGKKGGKAVAFGMEKFFQTFLKIMLIVIVLPFSFPNYTFLCISIILILTFLYIFFPRLPILKNLQEKEVENYRIFAKTVVYSLGIFTLMSLEYYVLLNQVNSISLLATLHSVIYLWGAGILPISISGLGVREGLAVYFLGMYNIPAAHAIATSLFLFTLNTVLPAMVGIYFIYKRRAYFKEVKHSVKSPREILNHIRNNK